MPGADDKPECDRGDPGVFGADITDAAADADDDDGTAAATTFAVGTPIRSGDMRGLCGEEAATAAIDVIAIVEVVDELRARGDAGAGFVGRSSLIADVVADDAVV